MQISDLNNNLLNMITGQNVQKTEKDGESRFSDLLQMIDKSATDIGLVADDNKVSIQENYSHQAKDIDVRKSEKQEQRVSSAEDNKVQSGEDNKESDVKKQSKTSEKNEKKAETKETAVASQKNNTVQEIKEGEASDADVALVEEIVSIPVMIADNELSFMVVPAEAVLAETGVEQEDMSVLMVEAPENVEETQEIGIMALQPREVARQNNDDEKPVEILESVEDVDVEDVVEPEKENIEVMKKETKDQLVVSENKPVDEIQVQEEKIAEKLPENKQVEVKVTVTKDVVNEKPIMQNNLVKEVSEEIEIKEFVEPELIKESAGQPEILETSENINLIRPEMGENVSIKDIEVEQTIKTTSIQEIATVTEVAENNMATSFVAEVKPAVANVENNVGKDIYNKGLPRETVEQIKVNITQSAIKGVDKIEIQLKPADLGQIEIKLHIGRDGKLQAHVVASNIETLEILQKDMNTLKEAFNNAGYQAEDGSFSFSYRGEGQNDNEREQLRQFIGEVITHDVKEEAAANDYISADGVNIRV